MTRPARFVLAELPTPLTRAARLERELGIAPFFVKRDDLTGFAVAGNKARKLETIVAGALEAGADTLLTGGGPGSNHCAATAAAARVAGLGCELVLYGDPSARHVNLDLARSFGAAASFTGDAERGSVDRALRVAAERLRAEGKRPCVVPRGGATPLGAAAYGLVVDELAAQLEGTGGSEPCIVVAAGSCGTQGGLVAGACASGRAWRVIGASVSRPPAECRARVLALARAACPHLGGGGVDPSLVEVVDARGPGYGVASDEGERAAEVAGATEGLLLDPVFTAKAFAVALEVAAASDRPVVFVHTGGVASALWHRRQPARGEPAVV